MADEKTSWNSNGDRVVTSADGKETRVYEELFLGKGECKTIIDNTKDQAYEADWTVLGYMKGDKK